MYGRKNSVMSQSSVGQRAAVQTDMTIGRADFIENYPQLLIDIMLEDDDEVDDIFGEQKPDFMGVDICFKDLSLSIKLGKQSVKVVDGVTGRIQAKSMAAILGGSGAGKTSLLNVLCGRAYYGETKGSILVNGHKANIEDFKDSVGFVPQDDIVYAELTVRENLIYSGRFRLPKGTSNHEIAELADETLANLGLARVADSRVGDIRRRGVSGGEKKRVSIGLELMALPSILFCDEPTSGLDASSALLVMKSLKHLVEKDGVTVVSVIHQPRKFIYDLFDSLILLGVGGRMVYHGPTENAETYFGRLNYNLPQGESVADWLIDISSGRLEPDSHVADTKMDESSSMLKQSQSNLRLPSLRTVVSEDDSESQATGCDRKGDDCSGGTSPMKDSSDDSDHVEEGRSDDSGEIRKISFRQARLEAFSSISDTDPALADRKDSGSVSSGDGPDSPVSRRSTDRLAVASRVVTDGNCVGTKGVTTGKVVQALEEAKERRAWLCEEWTKYFDRLSPEENSIYEPPQEYDLPFSIEEPSFGTQFRFQFRRAILVAWRNRFSKIIDSTIIVIAVIVITALDGVTDVSYDNDPEISYHVMVRPLEEDLPSIFQQLFNYSLIPQIE
jgi:ABC-type multidrug transport system ATPase subunit